MNVVVLHTFENSRDALCQLSLRFVLCWLKQVIRLVEHTSGNASRIPFLQAFAGCWIKEIQPVGSQGGKDFDRFGNTGIARIATEVVVDIPSSRDIERDEAVIALPVCRQSLACHRDMNDIA